MTARRSRPTPFAEPCAGCGAQPGRYCLPSPPRTGPYHVERRAAWLASLDTTGTAQPSAPSAPADAQPVVDVTRIRRERDVAVAALVRVAQGGDAPGYVARCALRALGVDADEGPRAPLEMDADLRARLARDSADLHDPMETAR